METAGEILGKSKAQVEAAGEILGKSKAQVEAAGEILGKSKAQVEAAGEKKMLYLRLRHWVGERQKVEPGDSLPLQLQTQRDQTREGSLVHILFQPITGTQIRTQDSDSDQNSEQELMSWTQIRTKNRDSDQKARVFRLRGELSPHNPLHPSAHNLKALMVNCLLFSYKGKSTGQPPYLSRYMGSSSG